MSRTLRLSAKPRRRKPFLTKTVLFDIDGVLVDVRKSYLESIRRTVELYLDTILAVRRGGRSLLSLEDVNRFKLLGGFNNDWDALYGLLLYFQHLVEKNKKVWGDVSFAALRKWKNWKKLKRRVPDPCGVRGIERLVRERHIFSYELAKDMFQEIYLGERLFEKLYGRKPLFSRGRGLIHQEKLLVPRKILASLAKKGFALGIVTGRIQFEADVVLKRFRLERLFRVLVTHDDVAREEKKSRRLLRKPHPFSILLAARKMRARSCLYVGDLPDDIRAANRAKRHLPILACGVVYGQDHPRSRALELRRAGADFVIKSPASLPAILSPV